MDVAFESFGPSRLMIGSDWPVCTLAASYTRAINLVENYLSQHATEVQEAILVKRAAVLEVRDATKARIAAHICNGKNKREGDAADASQRGCARSEK